MRWPPRRPSPNAATCRWISPAAVCRPSRPVPRAFPHGIPPGETAFSHLYALAHAGLRAKYRPVTPAALKQLAHELAVIEAAGLADYFLIVWDIVR